MYIASARCSYTLPSFAGDVWAVVHHDVPKISEEDSLLLHTALEIQQTPPDFDTLTLVTAVMSA